MFRPISTICGGLSTAAAGSVLAQTSNPWWLGLLVAAIGGAATSLGAVVAFFSTRSKHKLEAIKLVAEEKLTLAQQLADEQATFRDSMFAQIGALREWSTQQDTKIQRLEGDRSTESFAKFKCLGKLALAHNKITVLEDLAARNSDYIKQLEERLNGAAKA